MFRTVPEFHLKARMSGNVDVIETDGECLTSALRLYIEDKEYAKDTKTMSEYVTVDKVATDAQAMSRHFDLKLSDCSTTSKKTQDSFDSGIQCSAISLESNFDALSLHDKFPVQCSQTWLGVDESERLDEPCDSYVTEVDLFAKDSDGDTLIHIGILTNKTELSNSLIDIADDVQCLNIQNELHQSPLHLAVLTSQQDIVRKLVFKGANVTLRDKQGNTPLHIACRKGDEISVRIILESFGKDMEARLKFLALRNCEGFTCLHVAAQMKEYMIMGYLFAKGIDVNIGDAKSGRNILHYAVERNDLKTVSLLLTHPNIDVDYKTFKGETPLIMAYWRNYQHIVKQLKSSGAYFSYDIVEDSDDEYV